jgi:hypothetical protein
MRALMKLGLLLVGAVAGVAGVQAQSYVSRGTRLGRLRKSRSVAPTWCAASSCRRVCSTTASARPMAWHCEAQGSLESYWAVLSMRRTSPDTTDVYYRDLTLPFVLSQRVRRLQ